MTRLLHGLCLIALWWMLAGAGSAWAQVHLTQASIWPSASTTWEPPNALDAASLDNGDRLLLGTSPQWQPVALPHAQLRAPFGGLGQGLSGDVPQVFWYRLRLPAAAPGIQEPRLYLPRWQTSGTLAVYVNERLAWQSGSQVWSGFNHPLWIDLDGFATPGQAATVHVRMASTQGAGGALSSVWTGTAQTLLPSLHWRTFWQTGLVTYWRAAFTILSLFAFALWFRYRRSRPDEASLFLLFFAMSVSQSVAALLFLMDSEDLDMDYTWFCWMTLVALLASLLCMFQFLCKVQGQQWPRLGRVLPLYLIAVAVVTLPPWWPTYLAMLPVFRLLLIPAMLVLLVGVAVGAWRLRSRSSALLALWGASVPPLSLHDMAMQNHLRDIEGIYLTPYFSVWLLMLFLVIVFTRYSRAQDMAVHARDVLAERLAAQEHELVQAHERLRTAERDQTLMHERQRLMREMHDGVGSSLMSALRLVEHGHRTANGAPLDVAQVLKECIDDLKLSIDSLEPVHADLLALLAALRYRLGPRLEGAGMALRWRMNDLPPLPWLDAQSALHVLRILQEVLTNIVKHSGAAEIILTTTEAPSPTDADIPGVQVRVQDNGRPFTPPTMVPPGRRGLGNVRSRARALGANVAWVPGDAGTVFTLWLPLAR
ncbi:sensor histidine kinase [Ottowia sp. VDI28]|uniref:sensor histidine kinase n=1 Tax=Ottowia sp. VDI28 TaxID=3133968 RepID=UPI003C30A42E